MTLLRLGVVAMLLALAGRGATHAAAAFPTTLRNDDGLPSLAPMLRAITSAVVNISVLFEFPRPRQESMTPRHAMRQLRFAPLTQGVDACMLFSHPRARYRHLFAVATA